MYAIDIICSNGHIFESWFKNRASFETQKEEGLVCCPTSDDNKIKQALSPVRIGKHKDRDNKPSTPRQKPVIRDIIKKIEENFEDVGKKFPEEALKIHLGETNPKNIRGIATPEEEKELAEEGVPIFKIPNMQ